MIPPPSWLTTGFAPPSFLSQTCCAVLRTLLTNLRRKNTNHKQSQSNTNGPGKTIINGPRPVSCIHQYQREATWQVLWALTLGSKVDPSFVQTKDKKRTEMCDEIRTSRSIDLMGPRARSIRSSGVETLGRGENSSEMGRRSAEWRKKKRYHYKQPPATMDGKERRTDANERSEFFPPEAASWSPWRRTGKQQEERAVRGRLPSQTIPVAGAHPAWWSQPLASPMVNEDRVNWLQPWLIIISMNSMAQSDVILWPEGKL